MPISQVARRFVEKVTRKWIYRRYLPQEYGGAPIFVTPSAGLRYLFKPMARIDPSLFRSAANLVRPNDVVWDIGANVGLFTFLAAARAGPMGRAFAFEPDTFLVDCLRKSALFQPPTSAPVTVIPTAIAAEISLRSFTIASRSRASNAIVGYGQTQMGCPSECQTVVTLNLDWLVTKLPPPNVVKCDVEGAESEVFTEQIKVLREIRPIIICEVAERAAAEMTAIFVGNGYVLYDGDKSLSVDARIEIASWNTIAIPEEREGDYMQIR